MATDIGSDAVNISKVNWTDQVADPAAPAAGHSVVYFKDGVLYTRSPITGILTPILNPMTAAGDLILGDTDGAPIRLAKGSDSDVLQVDPATHLPAWAAPAGGGAMVQIDQQIVGAGGAASITFADIPSTYTDLVLSWIARSTDAAEYTWATLSFNDDAGNNYDFAQLNATNSSHSVEGAVASGVGRFAVIAGGGALANAVSGGRLHIPAYAQTVFYKPSTHHFHQSGTMLTAHLANVTVSGLYRSTSAIAKIVLSPGAGNWAEGSSFTLWGIA